jgi:hypothetical protein
VVENTCRSIAGVFKSLGATTEQLTPLERWCRVLSQALVKYLHGRQQRPPALLLVPEWPSSAPASLGHAVDIHCLTGSTTLVKMQIKMYKKVGLFLQADISRHAGGLQGELWCHRALARHCRGSVVLVRVQIPMGCAE